jgi:hypothetical protein
LKPPLNASLLTPREFLVNIDAFPLTILDIATGLGEFLNKFYQGCDMDQILRGQWWLSPWCCLSPLSARALTS